MRDQLIKNTHGGKSVKCSALHKTHISNPPSRGSFGIFHYKELAGNSTKYQELYKNLMFGNLHPIREGFWAISLENNFLIELA